MIENIPEISLEPLIDQTQLRREQAERDLRLYNLGLLALSGQQQRTITQQLGPNALQAVAAL